MVRRACLVSIAAFALLFSTGAKGREGTEWARIYWYNANDNKLPRVLLVGDSICNGYNEIVRDELAGTAYVSFYATSKCASDRSYLRELAYVLEEYPYEAVHFNNGLHSLGTDRKEWEEGIRAALALIREKAKGAKIIWASSTPLKDAGLTEKAKELNEIAARVMRENNIPTDDLFALMDPMDRSMWTDTFHYNAEGRKMQGKKVAEVLRESLGGKKASEAEARAALKSAESDTGPDGKLTTASAKTALQNAGFEGNGGWSFYPPKPENGSLELDGAEAHSGKKSARITVLKSGYQVFQYKPLLDPGANYEISFWARSESGTKFRSFLRTMAPPYVYAGEQTSEVGREWKRFSGKFTAPADYAPDKWVFIFQLDEPGVFRIDDVAIEKK
ncbi:MAG: carbohydrate binding domain-containing protein [Spirochaetia bacterium]|nr:carbohydrate binding domain-containing protein [Spirochaetia bacterium]